MIHLAAWAGVRPSIQRPDVYVDVNIRGTVNLLEAHAKPRQDIARLRFSPRVPSVYGGRDTVPFRESDPVDRPISPYAASKKAGEVLCYTWHHLYGTHVAALRFFTVYGPRHRPEMAIHKFATMMTRGETIPMFGDGSAARDFTYIDDVVQGVLASLDRCSGYEIYNLGEERTTTLRELIDLLGARAGGGASRCKQEPNQPGDVPITFADVSKARAKLGYNAEQRPWPKDSRSSPSGFAARGCGERAPSVGTLSRPLPRCTPWG